MCEWFTDWLTRWSDKHYWRRNERYYPHHKAS
jgi:hypothetical protein